MLAARGLCAHHPNPEWWTATDGRTPEAEKAKTLCHSCPVFDECKEVADAIEESGLGSGRDARCFAGIRAGEGAWSRASRRRAAARAAA